MSLNSPNSWGGVCSWGVSTLGGMSTPGGCLLLGGVSAPGGVCSWGCLLGEGGCLPLVSGGGGVVSQHAMEQTTPVNRMTDRCKNITLPQTSFVGGKTFIFTSSQNITITRHRYYW